MGGKSFSHNVVINARRRENKRTNDASHNRDTSKKAVRQVFDAFYKNQVKALYRAILEE